MREKLVYQCQACGAQASKWSGQCPDCGEWNTLLESVAPIISSLARRHWQDVPDWFEVESIERENGDNRTIIENTVSAILGPRITPRETQVVVQVLEGHSSESISRSLGISTGTVRIHRRNIYAKLDISSQQELFSIFFQKIKTVRA